jgi:hypothetical protein
MTVHGSSVAAFTKNAGGAGVIRHERGWRRRNPAFLTNAATRVLPIRARRFRHANKPPLSQSNSGRGVGGEGGSLEPFSRKTEAKVPVTDHSNDIRSTATAQQPPLYFVAATSSCVSFGEAVAGLFCAHRPLLETNAQPCKYGRLCTRLSNVWRTWFCTRR